MWIVVLSDSLLSSGSLPGCRPGCVTRTGFQKDLSRMVTDVSRARAFKMV